MNDGFTSVLYVEDSPLNVIVMEAMFEQRRDLRLHVAEAGMPAWRLSAQLQPSLLLIDLHRWTCARRWPAWPSCCRRRAARGRPTRPICRAAGFRPAR